VGTGEVGGWGACGKGDGGGGGGHIRMEKEKAREEVEENKRGIRGKGKVMK